MNKIVLKYFKVKSSTIINSSKTTDKLSSILKLVEHNTNKKVHDVLIDYKNRIDFLKDLVTIQFISYENKQ